MPITIENAIIDILHYNTNMPNILEQLKILKQQLQLQPNNPILHDDIAKIYYHIKQIEQAMYHYKQSLSMAPDNWNVYLKLANCYIYKNDYEQAISYLQRCLAINPECTDAAQNLGMLLVEKREFAAALPYLEQAYHQNITNQKHFEFIEQLANCYIQIGDVKTAIKYLSEATKLAPNQDSAHHNLGILYLKDNNQTMANTHFKKSLSLNPKNHTAEHMLNALNQITTLQPPSNYVSDLFNQYANYYEQHVTTKLNYKLPSIFRNLYAKHALTTTAKNTLDLGCGTGLCGIYFRDATINLIGVDLAINMLLQAKQHHCYDLLVASNLQDSSIFVNNYFDLIIAADLFPYFGDLEQIFTKVGLLLKKLSIEHKSFNSRNMFIFNVELTSVAFNPKSRLGNKFHISPASTNLNYQLQPTGRYSHTLNYIQELAKKLDFTIIETINTNIRTHLDLEVPGAIWVMTKY